MATPEKRQQQTRLRQMGAERHTTTTKEYLYISCDILTIPILLLSIIIIIVIVIAFRGIILELVLLFHVQSQVQ